MFYGGDGGYSAAAILMRERVRVGVGVSFFREGVQSFIFNFIKIYIYMFLTNMDIACYLGCFYEFSCV